jgi:hypothetical protein
LRNEKPKRDRWWEAPISKVNTEFSTELMNLLIVKNVVKSNLVDRFELVNPLLDNWRS